MVRLFSWSRLLRCKPGTERTDLVQFFHPYLGQWLELYGPRAEPKVSWPCLLSKCMSVYQVKGFRGGEHKSFATREEAEQYIGPIVATTSGPAIPRASPIPPGQSPALAKRSRSLSPGRGQPSMKAEVYVGHVQY